MRAEEQKTIKNYYLELRNIYVFTLETIFNETKLPKYIILNSINSMVIVLKFAIILNTQLINSLEKKLN